MFSIIAIILAIVALTIVFFGKIGDLIDDRNYNPASYACPNCKSAFSYDEWDGGYCGKCGWDATAEQVAALRKNNEHAAADWIEGLNTVAARHYADSAGELDPQGYCRCGAHVNSVRCFTPAITNDEEVPF